MAVSIGPRIQVDGEEQYRRQINEIIQQAKTLDAEMDALTASFSANATQEEKAAASTKLLNQQLETARKRTELIRDMTEKAAAATGENSTQTLKWREALAAAEEKQHKLERAVEENTKAIEGQGEATEDAEKKMGGFGDQLNDVIGKLGIRLPDAAKDALNGMEGFSVGTVAAMGAAAGAVTAAYKAVSKLNEITLEAAANADALLTRSAQTGLSTELLQQLDYAQNFLDFDNIDQSLVKLTASMDRARDGAERQAEAFATLGVSVTDTDGQLRDNMETFMEVIDALGQVENETERDALANDLFGKSYAELKPLIDAGTDALRDYMAAAKENGLVLTRDQIEILGKVDDAYRQAETTVDALEKKIAVQFAPATIAAMEAFSTAIQSGANGLEKSGLISDIAEIVRLGAKGIEWASKAVDESSNWIAAIQRTAGAFDPLIRALTAIHDLLGLTKEDEMKGYNGLGSDIAGATWKSDVQAWVTAGGTIITPDNYSQFDKTTGKLTNPTWRFYQGSNGSLSEYQEPVIYKTLSEEELRSLLIGHNAAGTESWRGGWTWLGEGGPELAYLPQGSRVWSNQESERIVASGTDTSRMEALLERNASLLSAIYGTMADQRMLRRM